MPAAVAIWISACAYLVLAGWTLSALHELNRAGYAVALLAGLAAAFLWRRKIPGQFPPRIHWLRLRRRFCRPLPAIFLFLSFLIFAGGALHAPNNYDALTYRLPRMLNWLAAGHWFWIPTVNARLNYSTTDWEWTAMPLLALLRSDRGLFLINALGFFLMPGLLFSVFRQVGVARKVSWVWMWVLPLAYGYATQAGSIGNDLTGALFCLMSVYCGLRARRSGRLSDLWLAGVSAALMTGVKLSNLPLLLPCLVAAWPALPLLRKNAAGSAGIALVAVLVSAAPTVALNEVYTRCWTGDPQNVAGLQVKRPDAALLGNGLMLLEQSFMPPALPGAHAVSVWLDQRLPASCRRLLARNFPGYSGNYLNELPQEETSAMGLGITLLLLTAIGAAVCRIGPNRLAGSLTAMLVPVGLAAWVAALVFMLKMGSQAGPRLMLPYYALAVIPILRLPSQDYLLRFRAWKVLLALAALSVLPAVVLSPARPLWPATSLSQRLARQHPGSAAWQRIAAVYSAYARRNDALAPLRAPLGDNALTIGFVGGDDDSDYSLWRPFGLRKVLYLRDGIHPSLVVPPGVDWIVVKRDIWSQACATPLDDWAAQQHARIVLSVPILTVVEWGDQTWCLLHIERD